MSMDSCTTLSDPPLEWPDSIEISLADDACIVLDNSEIYTRVIPLIRQGGIGTCIVIPPRGKAISFASDAIAFHDSLAEIDSTLNYFITLRHSSTMTEESILEAHRSGIVSGIVLDFGEIVVKSHDQKIDLWMDYTDHLKIMEKHNIVLHITGIESFETSEESGKGDYFTTHLQYLSYRFTKLKIVVHQITSKSHVDGILKCSPNICGSISLQYLLLTLNDVLGKPLNYCEPLPRSDIDRERLRTVVLDHAGFAGRFFFGSCSVPHYWKDKCTPTGIQPGCYTSGYILPQLAHLLENLGCSLEGFKKFIGSNAREVLGLGSNRSTTGFLVREDNEIPLFIGCEDYEQSEYGISPFGAGTKCNWKFIQHLPFSMNSLSLFPRLNNPILGKRTKSADVLQESRHTGVSHE